MVGFDSPNPFARVIVRLVAPILVALAFVFCPLTARAGTILVDGTNCMLPDAIAAANLDTTVNNCTGASGADTLSLTSSTPYLLNASVVDVDGLTATPSVTSAMIISGGGAMIERSGVGFYRLFHVGSEGDLTLENVTVRNGDIEGDGGAIYNLGALTVRNSRIISNSSFAGAGIFNGDNSLLMVVESTVALNRALEDGGGIFNAYGATANFTSSQILSNTAFIDGGGLFNTDATMTLSDTVVISNTAYEGGGFFNTFGTLTLTNAEVVSNTALLRGGGIVSEDESELTIIDTTISLNATQVVGGGIFNDYSTMTLINSDILSNTAGLGGGVFNNESYATLTDSDIVSNTAYLGGGFFNSTFSTVTFTRSDILSNTAYADGGGLFNLDYSDFTLTESEVRANVAISNGGGIVNTALGVMTITLSTIGFNRAEYGGGIYNSDLSLVTLLDSDVVSNTATVDGGGILNDYAATLLITDSQLTGNRSEVGYGGGIFNCDYSTATLTNSEMLDNSARMGSGGGLYNDYEGTVTFINTTLISNQAANGGGVFNVSTTIFTNTDLIANVATVEGGGVYQSGGVITYTLGQLLNNGATNTGGALYQDAGATFIQQSCIVNNTDTAVNFAGGDVIDAANNWWGAPDGPSGAGSGAGDSVGGSVNFAPPLASALLNCPTLVADLSFAKGVTPPGTLLPGQPLTYTLTFTNNGVDAIKNIYVTDVLPAAFELDAVKVSVPFETVGNTYVIPKLAALQVATVEFVGRVDGTISKHLLLSNTATLSNSFTGVLTATTTNNVIVPEVNWSAANYSTDEDSGTFTATVLLSPTNPYTTVTVQAVITDNAEGAFLAAAVQQVVFPPNSSSQPVVVSVVNDGAVVPHTILLALQAPVGATLGENRSATLLLTEADVAVSLSADRVQAEAGDTIVYSYRITNTGNVTLTTIRAVDDQLSAVAALAGVLLPDESRSATLNYVVQQGDTGTLVNTVVVTGTQVFGNDVSGSASVTVMISNPTNLPEEPQQPRMEIYLPRLRQ